MNTQIIDAPEVYQGQFGEFTITKSDRTGVIIYRTSLVIAAISFAIASNLTLFYADNPLAIQAITPLYTCFSLALGVSLFTIHIYMKFLHQILQLFLDYW